MIMMMGPQTGALPRRQKLMTLGIQLTEKTILTFLITLLQKWKSITK